MTKTVIQYLSAAHYAWSDAHDFSTAYRLLSDDTDEMRMECKCGKTSRWTQTYAPMHAAVERHANEIAH